MQLGCLLIDHLPIAVELTHNPQLRGRPVVITEAAGAGRRVLDASPRARDVRPGMTLAEAVARCREAVLLEADPLAYTATFNEVLDGIEALGLDVEDGGLGLAYVRLDNAALLFGGVERVTEAVMAVVSDWLYPRMGSAAGKFPAYAAAGLARYGKVRWAPHGTAEFLAPLSVDLLPVSPAVTARLRSFGLHTLGQVAALRVGPLQAQFGPAGRLAWELANGVDHRPLVPRRHAETIEESLGFPSPQPSVEAIVTAVDVLLARAFSRPAMRGRAARACVLDGAVFRAAPWRKRMAFREPMMDKAKALVLVKHTLEGHPPPGPLEDLRLTLTGIVGEAGRQESLFSDVRRRENLREALRQLGTRLGKDAPVYRVREVEPWSRVPERRTALVPFVP